MNKLARSAGLAGFLVLALLLPPAFAGDPQGSRGNDTAQDNVRILRELSTWVANLNARASRGTASERARAVSEMEQAARARMDLLTDLVASDPAEVLRVAIPDHLRSILPASVQALTEESLDAEGTLEIFFEDGERESRLHFGLEAGKKRYALHFAGEPPTEFVTGDRVRVRGVRVGEAVALEAKGVSEAPSGPEPLASVPSGTFGEQKVLVMLVNFQNNTSQPYSVEHARSVTFTTTSDFMRENSYGQTWLKGDVAGWFTIAMDSSVCDTSKIASLARQAASAAGYNTSAYNRHVFAFPSNACSWWGLGSVGGNPSSSWINGTYSLAVVAHELGHNLGLYHSRSRDCGSDVLGPSCSISEYGDGFDMMGGSYYAHFNAYQKERIGWLEYGSSPRITTVQSSGDYAVDIYQVPGSAPKALKVLQSTSATTGKKTWYYVEYRRGVGFDGPLAGNGNLQSGVVFHLGSEASTRDIDLLDMTPETGSWSDPALVNGRSYTDGQAGVTVTALSTGSGGATVNVSFVPKVCTPANPQVSVVPSKGPWVAAGTTVAFDVTVTNKDGDGCAPASFGLSSVVPSGWTGTFDSPSLTVSPGSNGTTKLRVRSATGAADGFYDFTARASQASFSGSGPGTYVVASALEVSLSTDKAAYAVNQWVTSTATVQSGGSAVAGAKVTFTLTRANGTTVSQTVTSDASGRAVYRYRIGKKDPAGTWQVKSDAVMDGLAGTASVSFSVQ